MNFLDSSTYAKEQLRSLSPGIKLVILHPDFHGQHGLLASVLKEPHITPFFITIEYPETSLAELLHRLQEALSIQLATDLPALPSSPAEAAAAVAQTLAHHSSVRLLIDAFDFADQEEVAPFIAALANALPDDSRIVLCSRMLPRPLLHHEDVRGKTTLIPTIPGKMILDYVGSSDKNVLEVRALGPGRVLINGRLVDHWDGILPRTLFFHFVDRGMTTRDEIFNTFWPNLSTREATNVFHVTKRKISEILGTDLTVYWSGFYRLSPDLELHYDVVKFVEAVQNAAVAPDEEAIQLLQTAVEIYHGPFLSTMDQDWITNRRSELVMTYAEALAGLARIYRNMDDKLHALGYYLRAAATNSQREDLARAIMELYRDLGKPSAALQTYERLEEELRQDLDVTPSPQTKDLAESIRQSM